MLEPTVIPIESLVAHGFSRRVVEVWRAHGYGELLPLQARALAEYAFLRGRNLVVFAPTSSGKTFVAEMAAVRRLEQGHKVVYLVPTKALAEEKFRQWLVMYREPGLRIAIATRERPETDALVLEGRYDLLIAVYEKMKSYLVVQPEILGQVRLVVVDELQMLADPTRGATLELVLLKLVASPSPPQVIALSAVLGDAARLSQWMKSDLLLDNQELIVGGLARKSTRISGLRAFSFRAYRRNSGEIRAKIGLGVAPGWHWREKRAEHVQWNSDGGNRMTRKDPVSSGETRTP
jgi:replicative superfamily II helicase